MTTEIWRDAVGFEGLYEVSNFGNVRHTDTKMGIGGSLNSYGYRAFNLTKDKKRYTGKCHRLVAEAFIPNPLNKSDANHKDGDKDNNFVENLEWASRRENNRHARTELNIDTAPKPVAQLTPSGEVIAVWLNASVAGRVLDCSPQLIGAVCRGTAETANNFRWQFAGMNFEKGIKELRANEIRAKIDRLSHELAEIEK